MRGTACLAARSVSSSQSAGFLYLSSRSSRLKEYDVKEGTPQQEAHCKTDMAFSMLCGSLVWLLARPIREGLVSVPLTQGQGKAFASYLCSAVRPCTVTAAAPASPSIATVCTRVHLETVHCAYPLGSLLLRS